MGYATLNLSWAVEEGGTLKSPLIPWNAGGAFVISALGLGVMEGDPGDLACIPLAFACWLSPLLGMTYGFVGIFSPRASEAERTSWDSPGVEVLDLGDHDLADDSATFGTNEAEAIATTVTRNTDGH